MTKTQARKIIQGAVVKNTETGMLGICTWGCYPKVRTNNSDKNWNEWQWNIAWDNGKSEFRRISQFENIKVY